MELEKLKALLGIPQEDNSKDTALVFVMDQVEEIILNYCCVAEVPRGLLPYSLQDGYGYLPGGVCRRGRACDGDIHNRGRYKHFFWQQRFHAGDPGNDT